MADEIPINDVYSHPLVKELLQKIEDKSDELENIRIPYIIKDKVLMSPGVWNNYYYNPNVISEAFATTDWENKEIRSLFNDHEDLQSREWIGEVVNARLEGDTVRGDLVIVDKPTAQKLAYGAKMGISPKVHGQEEGNEMTNFMFDNFSVVINPAIKTAYINNKEQKTKTGPGGHVPDGTGPNGIGNGPGKGKADGSGKNLPSKIKIKEDNKMSEEEIAVEETPAVEEAVEEVTEEAPVEEVAEVEPVAEPAAVEEEHADKPKVEEKVDPKKANPFAKKEDPKAPVDPKEAPVDPKKANPFAKKEAPKKMAEQDIITQIIKLADMLAQSRKDACLSEQPAKVDTEMSNKVEKQDGVIQEMSDKIVKLEAKLNEPEKRKSIKTEELSEKDAETIIKENPDAAFMGMLNKIGGGLQ